ncbi:YdeI/OmpD-associated family protein [Nitratireductor luteus]|uniref:YdeI/OmpD-associated family protein n=1 Tax=Nitratireductor luteus TaxID=2976980 RepID=UPI0022404347|nr:YdeI/OmpD-associated family protein [Nitratireductor luteus]
MTTERSPKIDEHIAGAEKWRNEFEMLRQIALGCGLAEDWKWNSPCYTHNDKNIVLLQGFKEYCALLFFKGALLMKHEQVLTKQSPNMQAQRQIRFTKCDEIREMASVIQDCIYEAIDAEVSGRKIAPTATRDLPVPPEFQAQLRANPALKESFDALTPGRRRAYLLYFSAAKRSQTREARVAKHIGRILEGMGIDDYVTLVESPKRADQPSEWVVPRRVV